MGARVRFSATTTIASTATSWPSMRATAGVEVWAWVLMPNHVHLILVPHDGDALRRALAPVHRYYAGHVHLRQQRSGHFWQGRFGCVAMDDHHLGAALRYVALNPVRARLCKRAADWPWSSIHAHLGRADGLTSCAPVLSRYPGLHGRLHRASRTQDRAGPQTRQARTESRAGAGGELSALSPNRSQPACTFPWDHLSVAIDSH